MNVSLFLLLLHFFYFVDIKVNKFYPALRILDQVQKVHLRKGVAGDGPLFRFQSLNVVLKMILMKYYK